MATTTNDQELLTAVNQILSSCGQAPVTATEDTNPDFAISKRTLLQVSQEVQSEGWTFNKEYNVETVFTDDKEILVTDEMLQIKLSENSENRDYDGVVRDGKLYDRIHHKSTKWTDFSNTNIKCDIIWLWDWKTIPEPIKSFIIARAATLVSQRIVGDPQQYRMLQQQEAYARATALEYETQQGQFTFFGHPQGQANYYQSYQPYQTLKR